MPISHDVSLALVSHAADDARTLRVWAGIAHSKIAPELKWMLRNAPIRPTIVRALSRWDIDGRTSFWSGVFEFPGLDADTRYDVRLDVSGTSVSRTMKTLPTAVPEDANAAFNLLLLSCFHGAQDKCGVGGQLLSMMKPRPDLTIFAGDQVYLDLPTLQNFSRKRGWLEGKFFNDYLTNWFGAFNGKLKPHDIAGGFPQMLSLAPVVTIPDDHEYWNNAPFASPFVENTWTQAGRKTWQAAAERAFDMFQNGSAGPMGAPRHIGIDPLSILILDTRSQRNRGVGDQPSTETMRNAPGDLLGVQGRRAMTKWADDLVAASGNPMPHYGVLVTGQSLFAKSAGALKGSIADFEFPDYPADYGFLIEQLERVSRAGLPIVCLTGDVHWGRILRAPGPSGCAPIYEVISSPTSLVESVGSDQVANLLGGVKGLFGKRDPWPRHHDSETPPARFGNTGNYAPQLLQDAAGLRTTMRGNMALMLRFRRIGAAVDVEIEYIPLHGEHDVNHRAKWTAGFRLRPVK